jgi:uncharacterized protein YqjF (DUF2071 family)
MAQSWHDLLFVHWPVDPAALRPLVPRGLDLDTFDGAAWLGVVPFRMTGIRVRGLLPVPTLSAFAELNVRTYVTAGGRAGVWFFSLDAANPVAVDVARRFFHLPYFNATMECRRRGDRIHYASRRTHRGAPKAEFRGVYGPSGPPATSRAGSLEHFLTERYSLFSADAKGRLWRGDVEHAPWPLQPARAEIEANTMPPVPVAGAPLLHFARRVDVRIHALASVVQEP